MVPVAALISSLSVSAALTQTTTVASRPAIIRHALPVANLESRRDVIGVATAAFGASLAANVLPTPVFAESTLVTRQQAYTRYVPRIERGRDFWANGLKKMIASGDWKAISAALEKKGSIDLIFGPMELWASSWSGKTISEKSQAMNSAVEELREACQALKFAANGKESAGGMFSFITGPKSIDESKRSQLAKAAYLKGVGAINKYLEMGNDGLGLQFAPIDLID